MILIDAFFFDEEGSFVPGEYIVGLLASYFLKVEPNANIVHDPRVIWNIIDLVSEYGGNAIQTPTGHSFFKEKTRQSNAVYGGEMSAHHYFRDLPSDSGNDPMVVDITVNNSRKCSLSKLIKDRKNLFPSSGEINFSVTDATKNLKA